MAISERAGRPAEPRLLVDVDRLVRAYYEIRPDPADPAQRVAFGTSGHRGSSLNGAFNEAHIAATTEAICRYRDGQGTDGPLFIGRDTHALSEPAFRDRAARSSSPTASTSGSTPPTATRRRRPSRTRSSSTTAAAARAAWPTASSSRRRTTRPRTAASSTTRRTAARPTPTSPAGSRTRRTGCSRRAWTASAQVPLEEARAAATAGTTSSAATSTTSPSVIDMDAIRASGLRLGVDPLGGASVAYWPAIGERYGLDLTVTNDDGRPAVRVHDLRLGRPDPDGPVVAVRDGPAGRAARPVRRRVRQRHRRRPPRHRHARRRAAQPEPLPGRRGRVTCSAAAATGAPTWRSARPSSRAR